jgi:hypothetical protein
MKLKIKQRMNNEIISLILLWLYNSLTSKHIHNWMRKMIFSTLFAIIETLFT